uniref:GRAM domain-containing protein n=1 Tax=Romanomermis culicivorax TaxID=13658 RepID=A0A915JH04_ROMCU
MAASKVEAQISKPPRQKEIIADLKTRKTHRERRFHRLFRNVPTTEILLNRFSCAFVSDIGLLLQGHMYVSNDWICFHSNIFGIEKIIEIPVHSISAVCKARTAKIIPNAVCIKTKGGKQYFFGSLLSRDTTHHLLNTVLNRFQEVQIDDPSSGPGIGGPITVNDDFVNNNSTDNSYNSGGDNLENGGASSSHGQAQLNSLDSVTDVLLENSLQSSSSGESSDEDVFGNNDDRTKNAVKAENRCPTKVKIPAVKRTCRNY